MLSQAPGPDSSLAPGYPLPAPANLHPEVIDANSPWNAFSPPTAPTPPGGVGAGYGGAQVPGVGTQNYGTNYAPAFPQGAAGFQAAPPVGQQFGGIGSGIGGIGGFSGGGIGGAPLTQAFQPQAQFGQDPFLGQQQINPFGGGNSFGGNSFGGAPLTQGFTLPGANSAGPYRFGWQQRVNLQWLPDERVNDSPASGKFGWFGVDYELQWTQQMPGWVFITQPHFNFRAWDGPRGLSLPNAVYRFGYEFRMETPQTGSPYSFFLSATPSLNTDFQGASTSDAWNFDAKGAVIFRLDQYWQAVAGIQFWDRVDDRILPYGGLIYTDDFWELQLTFPEARASLFLGSEYMWAKWLYVRAEYHVESYEVDTRFAGTNRRTQVELEDWRVLAGLKMDTGYYDWFFEGGWVFGRDVEFAGDTPGFDIGTGFIGQLGFRF